MSGSEGAQRAPGPVRGKRGRGRKTTEATEPSAPAAKAQKAVNGDVAQQSATPWRVVPTLSAIWATHLQQLQAVTLAECKRKITNDYTFCLQFNDESHECSACT